MTRPRYYNAEILFYTTRRLMACECWSICCDDYRWPVHRERHADWRGWRCVVVEWVDGRLN